MLMISPETQLRAYATLRALEARAQAMDDLIGAMKRKCLHGGPGALAEMIATSAELRWQLRQLNDQAGELEGHLGANPSNLPLQKPKVESHEVGGIRGAIEVFGVPDLVSLLSTLRKTGTLTLQGEDSMFAFEFERGKVVHAITNKQDPTMRLGTILVAQNKLSEEQLRESLAASLASKDLLGTELVRSATVSESDLRAALDLQVRRIFDAAFALRQGRFAFLEGNLSNIYQRTCINTTQLLLEAARLRDEDLMTNSTTSLSLDAMSKLDSIMGG